MSGYLSHIITILFAVSLSGFIWLMTIREKDAIEPEPVWSLIKAVIFGGFWSIFFLGIIYIPCLLLIPDFITGSFNSMIVRGEGPLFATILFGLFIGVVEESSKALAALVFTAKLKEFDEPADGMIYGMAIALGFAVFENVEYVQRYSLGVLMPRSFLSVPLHIACGAIWGYGIALSRFKYKRPPRLLFLLPFIFMAAFLHGVYDFVCFMRAPHGISLLLPAIITLVAYRWSVKQTRRLVAVSPFLHQGECCECRNISTPEQKVCQVCGKELPDRSEFYCEEALKEPMPDNTAQEK